MLGFRFALKAGGCSGYEYSFYPTNFSDKYDTVFESNGVKIYVDKKSLTFVDDTEIGIIKENLIKRFSYDNPHAKSSCGCGISIELK